MGSVKLAAQRANRDLGGTSGSRLAPNSRVLAGIGTEASSRSRRWASGTRGGMSMPRRRSVRRDLASQGRPPRVRRPAVSRACGVGVGLQSDCWMYVVESAKLLAGDAKEAGCG